MKEIGIIMSPTTVGKSWWLLNQCLNEIKKKDRIKKLKRILNEK